ncbi:MAG: NifB/NifX family molybdenum-iron cluster-binding protein [Nautiliaceae bacterium]
MRVAFPTNNQKTIANHIGLAKGFLIIDTDTNEKFYIQNPIIETIKEENINLKSLPQHQRGLGTGRIVPVLLAEAGVDALVAEEFGESMVKNLVAEGITPLISNTKDIQETLNTLESLESPNVEPQFRRGFGRRYQNFQRGLGRGLQRGFGRGFGRRCRWED